MQMVPRAIVQHALLLLLVLGGVACDSKQEQPAPVISEQPAKAEAKGQVSIEELPDRNIEGMDVCALLPGTVVASALNLSLAETTSGSQMCSYTLRGDSGPDVGVVVSLTKSVGFIVTRNTSENAKDLPGLDVAAFTRKATGIHQDLWVARKDGLFLRIAAHDSDIAEPVARVALETIP